MAVWPMPSDNLLATMNTSEVHCNRETDHLYKIFRQAREGERKRGRENDRSVCPVMLTRVPAELSVAAASSAKDRKGFISGRRERERRRERKREIWREREKLLPRLFVTMKGTD